MYRDKMKKEWKWYHTRILSLYIPHSLPCLPSIHLYYSLQLMSISCILIFCLMIRRGGILEFNLGLLLGPSSKNICSAWYFWSNLEMSILLQKYHALHIFLELGPNSSPRLNSSIPPLLIIKHWNIFEAIYSFPGPQDYVSIRHRED
jgi:hypothetical protein